MKFYKIILSFILLLYTAIVSAADQLPIKKVLLVVAMQKEATPMIQDLDLHPLDHSFSNLPMHGYMGKYHNLDILLMVNGTDPINKVENVATQAATLTTYLGIEYFHPDLVISIGTAGGVEKNGAKLKEIYTSQKIYFIDRRMSFKGYREYGLGGYTSASFDQNRELKPGIICSGDSFDDNATDYNMFLKQHCAAIDMEAAGVAWVSMLTKTPMLAIKGVTNFVKGKNIHNQYEKNFPIVVSDLANKLKEFLASIGK